MSLLNKNDFFELAKGSLKNWVNKFEKENEKNCLDIKAIIENNIKNVNSYCSIKYVLLGKRNEYKKEIVKYLDYLNIKHRIKFDSELENIVDIIIDLEDYYSR